MGNVTIEYVKLGMVLESYVKDGNGRLLLHAGTEIKVKHINIFRTWGIPEVDIHGITKEDVAPAMSEQDSPLSKVPFIMVTARNDKKAIIEAKEAGVTDYIIKPLTVDVLNKKLRKALFDAYGNGWPTFSF